MPAYNYTITTVQYNYSAKLCILYSNSIIPSYHCVVIVGAPEFGVVIEDEEHVRVGKTALLELDDRARRGLEVVACRSPVTASCEAAAPPKYSLCVDPACAASRRARPPPEVRLCLLLAGGAAAASSLSHTQCRSLSRTAATGPGCTALLSREAAALPLLPTITSAARPRPHPPFPACFTVTDFRGTLLAGGEQPDTHSLPHNSRHNDAQDGSDRACPHRDVYPRGRGHPPTITPAPPTPPFPPVSP